MNINTWTPESIATLTRRAAEGRTALEIGAELRVTRNAVLGRAHRMGIKLPLTPEKRAAMGGGVPGAPRKARRPAPLGSKTRMARPKGTSPFTRREKVHAIAARMAGASWRRAADEVGASFATLRKGWISDASLCAEAAVLLQRAVDDASQRRATRIADLDAQRSQVQRHNENILLKFGTRNADFIRRRLSGESLSAIGRDFGLTRERIRQILHKGIAAGIQAPPGIRLLNDRDVP